MVLLKDVVMDVAFPSDSLLLVLCFGRMPSAVQIFRLGDFEDSMCIAEVVLDTSIGAPLLANPALRVSFTPSSTLSFGDSASIQIHGTEPISRTIFQCTLLIKQRDAGVASSGVEATLGPWFGVNLDGRFGTLLDGTPISQTDEEDDDLDNGSVDPRLKVFGGSHHSIVNAHPVDGIPLCIHTRVRNNGTLQASRLQIHPIQAKHISLEYCERAWDEVNGRLYFVRDWKGKQANCELIVFHF
jgi:hypothetical protein